MARRSRVRCVVVAIMVALLALTTAGTASAQQFPTPPPDFAHPAGPHAPLFSPSGGDRDRPLLAIHLRYSDVGFNANIDAAALSQRIFGTGLTGNWPSAMEYLRRASFGRLNITPAAEIDTSGNGAVNDGVVRAQVNMTRAAYAATAPSAQITAALQAAVDLVDFRVFDTNRDGAIGKDELVIHVFQSGGLAVGEGCGAVFPQSGDVALNVTVDTMRIQGFGRAGSLDATLNRITLAHETGHIAVDLFDMYVFPTSVDLLDWAGNTCSVNGDTTDTFWAPSAWMKMHLGWITPTVVTRDGYYDLPQAVDQTGRTFLLYDPSRGVGDYFLVENRQVVANSPDSILADSGLVVWRAREAVPAASTGSLQSTPPGCRATPPTGPCIAPFELIRPDGASGAAFGSADAFDARDPRSVPRTMDNPWQDGTPSNVAVRAVGNSGPTMRAYFDVRGPGVLVDAYNLDQGDPANTTNVPRLSPGDANDLGFAVMNTGAAAGSFEFSVTGLPAGWTATTRTMTLDPGQEEEAILQVTPPLAARADQVYPLTLVGRSTTDSSVTTTTPVRVRVLPKISIGDVTVTEGDAGTQDATFTLSLSEASIDTVSVDFGTADGTATAPSDYGTRLGSVNFLNGNTSIPISVRVNGDTAPEPDEQFVLRLSNARGGKIVDAEGVGTIRTDPEPSLSIDDVRVVEEATTATFTVALSEANNTPVSVAYATGDLTATAPADYAATSGTLDYPVGETRRTISVPINEDVADEIDEELFTVTLSGVVNANIGDGQGQGIIRDDDRNGVFACRAAGVRLGTGESGVANPPRTPCRDDSGAGLPLRLGSGLLSVGSATGSASTNQTPDDLTGTQPQIGDRATAHAEATTIEIRAGLNLLRISGLVSDAAADCTGTGPPRLTSSSQVNVLALNGAPVVTTSAATTIPLVLATLRLNQTVVGPTGITQRALVVDNFFSEDIVLGEAFAGFGGTAVHPDGHPCVV